MRTILLIALTLHLLCFNTYAQEEDHSHDVFQLEVKKDAIILGTGLLTTILGDRLLKRQAEPSLLEINSLLKGDLWGLDANATDNYSSTAETISDVILFSSAALPFGIYLSNKCRGEELDVLVMISETFLITNGVTNIVKASTKRYRPYTYNADVSEETKLKRTSNRSFFSGHASNTSAFCFLTASALNKMHPHWKSKRYISWGTAAIIPLAISYGRYKAGKHFPSDVLTGYVFGAAVGLLVPSLHTNGNMKINVGPGSISLNTKF